MYFKYTTQNVNTVSYKEEVCSYHTHLGLFQCKRHQNRPR